ncbi:MAG TPA: bifunctional (p)ppGpp synthetase/guanosine-3',5'-bis(diphosphate) 3'-pyrophosphohydrolase [Steroidobacteraceae bacterium]|jgi:guanosine-3',5'-bis(diphosphate) 3'-pyrophosphohydrolase|nr:bifunctional (p)ppGpp synthetase/guanosine-3',5'-bis(diphosphate) 3'-pyrophosphohydrolase [Steroidobacteraceae bacterium]
MDYASSILGFLPGGRRSTGISQLLDKLEAYLSPAQVERVREAYDFGAEKHQGQKRVSGEPYITHPVAVADILADLRLDADTLVAAILHDVIEDTPTAKAEIASIFGQVVAELVDGVSKLDQIQFKNRQEAQAESFRKMLLAMVRDIRVIMVKLADRMHNMRTLGVMPPVKRRRSARETLEIYAPIAERLGLYAVKLELEDLGFRALYPYRYKVLERELKRARGNQKEFIAKIAETFKGALKKAVIEGAVEGREKHLYSIYKKMQNKKISINEMVDVYGFRIIVDNADVCYRVLGLVHSVYKPMPGRFKDYIAIPRVNGYQSLHTTLFGPNGVPIEVQIRSEQMHRVAESGIAAHWKYKSGGDTFGGVEHDRAREWLASLVQIQEGGSSEEFLESVKVDLFPDKVYVFTPKGKILRLPTGATTVDFAYAIHTDVGNRCVAAKVDRRLVPLRTPLRNGQTVEIITAKGAKPNPSWSSFLVTAKARAAIRQYLKNLKKGDALELGRRLLGLALEEFSLSLKKIPAAQIETVVKELNLRDADELYEKIGLGERLAPLVARRLQPANGEGELANSGHAGGPLMIAGTEGLLVTYARCCFPIPNDPIMAYLSAGRGVMIHRQNCGNLAEYRKQPDKWLSVAWEPTRGRLFSSEIQLEINNRVGVLAAVASSIAGTETNIDQVSLEERDVNSSSLKFQVQVRDRKHLARVIRTVRRMPDVQRVFRSLA